MIEMERLVHRFPLSRRSPVFEALFTQFASDGTGIHWTVERVAPIIHLVQRQHRARETLTRTRRHTPRNYVIPRSEELNASAASQLSRLMEILDQLMKQEGAVDGRQFAVSLEALVGAHEGIWLLTLEMYEKFVGFPEHRMRWLRTATMLAGPLEVEASFRYFGRDLLVRHTLSTLGETFLDSPERAEVIGKVGCAIRETRDRRTAAHYIRLACISEKRGVGEDFNTVTHALNSAPNIALDRWWERAQGILANSASTEALLETLQHGYMKNMFLAQPLEVPEMAAVLRRRWKTARELETIHPQAATAYLRHVAPIEATHGTALMERFITVGRELKALKDGMVSALLFINLRHLPNVEPPNEDWFGRLVMRCQEDPASVDGVRSDLWLRLQNVDLSRRWETLADDVYQRFRQRPHPWRWRLEGLSGPALLEHLRLWTMLLESNFIHKITLAPMETTLPEPDPHVHLREALSEVGEERFTDEARALRSDRSNLQMWDIEQLTAAGRRVRPGDVLEVLGIEGVTQGNGHKLFVEALARRRHHYPNLYNLSKASPSEANRFQAIRIRLDYRESLVGLMPGSQTGSCTDGPRGNQRIFGLIHWLHHTGLKILIEGIPIINTQHPRILGSVPGWHATSMGRDVIWFDSIDLGEAISEINVESLSSVLSAFIFQLSEQTGFPVLISVSFMNPNGRKLLPRLEELGGVPLQAQISISTNDLMRRQIDSIYIDSLPNHIVATKDGIEGVGVSVLAFSLPPYNQPDIRKPKTRTATINQPT